ncbi:hypothetical protein C7M84_006440 [Penaeus vannamei]|uniref:Peptidase M14 domain-containing protein n=1 Tax=Penaeus vannamei TaxID=6689 RepID=A0A3R7PKR5_PENVA|nr:hypothetical protein C7M84_006440 [Penaeus vannamei]
MPFFRGQHHRRHPRPPSIRIHESPCPFLLIAQSGSLASSGERRRRREVDSREAGSCTADSCPAPLSDAYMTLQQMEFYLREINTTYAPRVSVQSIGKSVEGRDIWMVHVKSGGCAQGDTQPQVNLRHPRIAYWMMKRRAVWIEGGE